MIDNLQLIKRHFYIEPALVGQRRELVTSVGLSRNPPCWVEVIMKICWIIVSDEQQTSSVINRHVQKVRVICVRYSKIWHVWESLKSKLISKANV